MKFTIVSSKRTKTYLLTLIFFVLSLIAILLAVFVFDANRNINGILAVCLSLSLILLAYVKQYIEIGVMELSTSGSLTIRSRVIGSHHLNLNQLKNLKLTLSSYERKVITGLAFSNEGTTGLGNYLKFTTQNRNNFQIEIFIKTKNQFEFLEKIKRQFQIPN
ncbi:hypothetical protein QYS49_39380 [Marivirga salinae]|uniref:PH domain-containing protein n=1 Tax=Marivirga salinarum TaxID=3059078 RepID=A0AA51NAA6_9BACT|nr:hypothetical protein [Marivirga sp. BDSF4-3]WMN11721.1 hypothetical protein QYS49_39380 [Marivirga sp. BDSF4-3]